MKRKKVFATEVLFWLRAMMGILFLMIGTVLVAAAFFYNYTALEGLMFVGLPCGILLGGLVVGYRKLVNPYEESRALFCKFIQGETYQEVISQEYLIFEEQREVFSRFNHMLDKKDIISASTKQAELLALQNQINPHFLYNTLEAIRGDALCEGLESIADTTEALSTFFRYTITETKNLVSLEDELENVENYFKIQQYRFGEKLKMEVHLPTEGDTVLQKKLPKLTLQPIIENAIFHGLESRAEGGTILIQVETTPRKLLLSIKDDGVGMSEEKLAKMNARLDRISVSSVSENKRGGIALANVCRRIKLLFGEEYGVHIFSIQGIGTDVRVTIPMIGE